MLGLDAACPPGAHHPAIVIHSGHVVGEQLGARDDRAALGQRVDGHDARDPAVPVLQPLDVHDEPARERLGYLLHDHLAVQVAVGVAHHGAQTADGVAGVVRMHRGHGTGVVGLHGLQHVVGLCAPALAHDDAVGAAPERDGHQLAHAHRTLAFHVRLARLHSLRVRRTQAQLRCVLQRDDALACGNELR